MKWIDEIVSKILKEFPNDDVYTCACGLSTTGLSHIGNFRELIITYFVSEELKKRGKNVRLILSFDDFDRLKKVPYNVDKSFQEYVGMPNYSIPSPIGNHEMYAEYFENLVIDELRQLGIDMEYIRQSQKYLAGCYDDNIVLALDNRELIFDIISKHKTQEVSEKEKMSYYPVRVYCSKCNRDFTTITSYSADSEKVSYCCACGYEETISVREAKIKLKFNVDWPMRWNYEHVRFEPCGRGHADVNGALTIARKINSQVFGENSPVVEKYEFLNLKSNSGRMNKNSANVVTITDVLNIISREMLLWVFLMTSPDREITFSLDENIIKLYKEYEKFMISSTVESKRIKEFLHIKDGKIIKFSDLIKYLPIVNFDIEKLKEYVEFDMGNKDHLCKIKCAICWLQNYSSNKYWEFNDKINFEYWSCLTIKEKEILKQFKTVLESKNIRLFEEFINHLGNCKEDLRRFYTNFYNMVFGTSKGIPLKRIFENFDLDKIICLLSIDETYVDRRISSGNEKTILHLSDLHFDVGDYGLVEDLDDKWERMISSIKANGLNLDYLVVTGDIICFYNMIGNYEMANKFLTYLIDELRIVRDNIILCTGNHEHFAYDYQKTSKLFEEFELQIKPVICEYSKFQKKLLGYGIDCVDDLYYIRTDDLCDFFVINSLYALTAANEGVFLQDKDRINEILSTYNTRDKYRFIISHAPRLWNSDLFFGTSILDKFNINLGGHKHFGDSILTFDRTDNVELLSGNIDGFVDSRNSYNLYSLSDERALVRKIIYKNGKWNIN